MCKNPLSYVECKARVVKSTSASAYTYRHEGKHFHPPPPGGKVHPQQYKALKTTVQYNPNARPHKLLVGTSLIPNGPGDSIGNIAPQFNNLATVSRLRRKVLSNTPGMISAIKGSDTFIVDFLAFRAECSQFVQYFQLDEDVAIVSVQTEFIQELMSVYKSGLTIYEDAELGNEADISPMIFDHGCVTDAANKFFITGKLLVTCYYFEVLHRWQPILLSWIGKETKETYASHFLTLFKGIAKSFNRENNTGRPLISVFHDIIATVVDFSDSQRIGFQLAYAELLTTTQFGLELMLDFWNTSKGREFHLPSFEEQYTIGGTLLKGCAQHWRQSVNRIATNRNVIPEDKESLFRHLVSKLVTADNVEIFNLTVLTIHSHFQYMEH
jgi:hypothetical protein